MNIGDTRDIVSDANSANSRVLRFKGDEAIQLCSIHRFTTTSLYARSSILLFITDGSFHLKHGATKYTLQKTQMALLKKDTLVECSIDSSFHTSFTVNYVLIHFPDHLLKDFVKLVTVSVRRPDRPAPVTIAPVGARLLKFIDSLLPYFADNDKVEEYLIKIKRLELLFNLLAVENDILPQLMDMREHYRADITTTIEENLMSSISLPQLAALAGRSLSSFRRDFMLTYNMPPSALRRLRRLEKARELLLNTSMTVTDVCYTLGFENLAHFSRLFKGHFGYCPSKARTGLLKPKKK